MAEIIAYNTEEEVDEVVRIMPVIVRRFWRMSPTYLDYQKQRAQGGK